MTEPPIAVLLRHNKISAVIRCPYCQRTHRHQLFGRGPQWFAPRCGMRLNPEQRARGYRFNTMEENK